MDARSICYYEILTEDETNEFIARSRAPEKTEPLKAVGGLKQVREG